MLKQMYNASSKTYASNIKFAKTLIREFPRCYFNVIKSIAFKQLWKDVLVKTAFLDKTYKDTDMTRLYYYINKLTSIIKCQQCNKVFTKSFSPLNPPQYFHCDDFCAQQDQAVKNQIRQTKEENHTTTKDLLNRTKARNIQRLGCEWFFQTQEFKDKSLETMLSNGYDHPMHSDTIRNQMSADYFNKTGYTCPFQNPVVQKRMKKKLSYDGVQFDSVPEVAYYIWLKDNNISFEHEPMTINYDFNGKNHVYMPDFIVEGQLIELKGNQFFKEDGTMQNPYDHSQDGVYEAKHQCMIANNVKILRSNDYQKYVDYVNNKYGKDFLSTLKVS